MTPDRINSLVRELLIQDATPSSPDYSPYEYGETTSKVLSSSDIEPIVIASFQLLPSSLARAFLDGVLTGRDEVAINQATLLNCLVSVVDIGSAGHIVDLLRQFGQVESDAVAGGLIDRLRNAGNGNEQDRLAFALWWMFCGERIGSQSGAIEWNPKAEWRSEMRSILKSLSLTQYARAALEECVVRLDSRAGE